MRVVNWSPGKVTAEVEKKAMDRMAKAAEVVAEKARGKVPIGKDITRGGKWGNRKAGALRDSIRVTRLAGDPKQNIRIYAGSKAVFYARFVEYGTKYMSARPFMRPALNGSKSQIMTIMENG
jgi:HK97 gp10 family phage protein